MRYRLQRHDGTDCSATMVPITVLRMVPIQRYRHHPILQSKNDTPVRIWVDIRISNGLYLSQKNLSYPDWVRMVEKLEGLC